MKRGVFLLLMLVSHVVMAQDAHYSQYFSNPIYLNPALAGDEGCSRVVTAYRLQWPNIDGSYHTGNVSYDRYIKQIRGGLAINYLYDNAAGTLESHQLSVAYAYKLSLASDKLKISPAIEVGWRHNELNTSNLFFNDMIDPRFGFIYPTTSASTFDEVERSDVLDIAGGLSIFYRKFRLGVVGHHLTQPDEGFTGTSRLPIKLTAYLQYGFDFGRAFNTTTSFLFLRQQDFMMMLPSLVISYNQLIRGGIAVRANPSGVSAIVGLLGFNYLDYGLAYSYDFGLSGTWGFGGSHEINFTYRFNHYNKEGKPRYKHRDHHFVQF